jgi:hypothetical protein
MWSFLLGLAAAAWTLNNRPRVIRALATLIIKSEECATAARRKSVELSEDWEDIVAEARAQRDLQLQNSPSGTAGQVIT